MQDKATSISQHRLTELRRAGIDADRAGGPFIDPHLVSDAMQVLHRRGERWASAVLGRDLSKRSALRADLPWLRDGELHALRAADAEEDRAALEAMSRDA